MPYPGPHRRIHCIPLQERSLRGCRRLIEIREGGEYAFRMKYYNSDGGPADMCGNGARCICRFALELGLVKIREEFLFQSDAGVHRGLVTGHSESRIWLTEPTLHFTGRTIEVGNETLSVGFADTGVPHAVVMTRSLEDGSFQALAPLIRSHPLFGRQGVNVNWVMPGPDGGLSCEPGRGGLRARPWPAEPELWPRLWWLAGSLIPWDFLLE